MWIVKLGSMAAALTAVVLLESASAQTDADVLVVGIGFVKPICDPLRCSSGDEALHTELVEEFQKDDQVTVVDVRMGTLFCDSLDGAEGASRLKFELNPTETVIAERTYYTVQDGSAFTDGIDRKIWIGEIIDPVSPDDSVPRVVSMTWGDPCDVETFLLKAVSRRSGSTASVITSRPCAAGSSLDMCVVELDVDFPPESETEEGDTNTASSRRLRGLSEVISGEAGDVSDMHGKAEDIRLLAKYLSATNEEKKSFHALGLRRLNEDLVLMPSGRRLVCSTQIDVLALYSSDAQGTMSDAQMASIIAQAFTSSNQATSNSEVTLEINLVHVAQLPYEQETSSADALLSLETNADVAELRDLHSADLVQMVGELNIGCGRGYIFNGGDDNGFSVVDVDCLDNFSHTHEMGHNLGCYHNREDAIASTEYAHGMVHCTPIDPYRTIMSYFSCRNGAVPQRVNYFSNPDVILLDKATGTATEDNARVIRENMLTVANFRSSADCTELQGRCAAASECCVGTCSDAGVCEAVGCIGDPHLVGFRGQKFDFTGEDGVWFALVSDGPCHMTNIRITAPVPDIPEITYITGVGMTLCDNDGTRHTAEITVQDPHNLETTCPSESPCLADGALVVTVDGMAVTKPGEVNLGDGLTVSAANLPGACRSFGFEKYWLAKSNAAEDAEASNRRLMGTTPVIAVPMPNWVLSDSMQTNPSECQEYVAKGMEEGSFYAHQSEHTSVQITSPQLSLRVSHGKVHQLPMRDPTDRFDLPDHVAFQMNLVFEDVRLGADPQGIVGETINPVLNAKGEPIMHGLDAIRGGESDYRVSGPFGNDFAQLHSGEKTDSTTVPE